MQFLLKHVELVENYLLKCIYLGLYTKGLVYLDVPINDNDCIVGWCLSHVLLICHDNKEEVDPV